MLMRIIITSNETCLLHNSEGEIDPNVIRTNLIQYGDHNTVALPLKYSQGCEYMHMLPFIDIDMIEPRQGAKEGVPDICLKNDWGYIEVKSSNQANPHDYKNYDLHSDNIVDYLSLRYSGSICAATGQYNNSFIGNINDTLPKGIGLIYNPILTGSIDSCDRVNGYKAILLKYLYSFILSTRIDFDKNIAYQDLEWSPACVLVKKDKEPTVCQFFKSNPNISYVVMMSCDNCYDNIVYHNPWAQYPMHKDMRSVYSNHWDVELCESGYPQNLLYT